MSILTDQDRAEFDTPEKRLMAVTAAFVLMLKEFGVTQADVNTCRERVNEVSRMMISQHVKHPGAGEKIDDIRARCDVLEAVLKYARRGGD